MFHTAAPHEVTARQWFAVGLILGDKGITIWLKYSSSLKLDLLISFSNHLDRVEINLKHDFGIDYKNPTCGKMGLFWIFFKKNGRIRWDFEGWVLEGTKDFN